MDVNIASGSGAQFDNINFRRLTTTATIANESGNRIYVDETSAIVNLVPYCWFLSAKLCTVAAKLPDLGRCPSRLCSSDMISAANSTKAGRHEVGVYAEPSFSFLLLRFVWGEERLLKPLDEPFVTGSWSRLSITDCASAESEPGGGRYPSAFCSSDWSLRASSAVRVLTLISLSALVVKRVNQRKGRAREGKGERPK